VSRGSIHRQPNGTWRARYRNPEGRDRSRNFDRKIDADRFLVSVEHSKQTGSYIDPSAGKVTFKSYAENWRGKQIHAEVLKLRSRRTYVGTSIPGSDTVPSPLSVRVKCRASSR